MNGDNDKERIEKELGDKERVELSAEPSEDQGRIEHGPNSEEERIEHASTTKKPSMRGSSWERAE